MGKSMQWLNGSLTGVVSLLALAEKTEEKKQLEQQPRWQLLEPGIGLSRLFCALGNWSVNGEAEKDWILKQRFHFRVLIVCGMLLSDKWACKAP